MVSSCTGIRRMLIISECFDGEMSIRESDVTSRSVYANVGIVSGIRTSRTITIQMGA